MKTLTNMPVRTQAVCGLIIYPDRTSLSDLEEIGLALRKKFNESIVEFTSISELTRLLDEKNNMQEQRCSHSVICLVSEKDFQNNNFDSLSPLVLRLGQSVNHPRND